MAAWRSVPPSVLIREDAAVRASARGRIAGFDLNDTLVSSRIGAPGYQVTVADWQLYNSSVAVKLRELHGQGFKLVIFTNQGNIRAALDGKRAQAVRAYIDALIGELAVPIQVFASTQRDRFRKPCVGMWEYLEQKANGGVPVDRSGSFYVGDAAGGVGEHSADDADFAKALGVKFIHTLEYFGPPSGSDPAARAPGGSTSSGSSAFSALFGQRPAKAPRLAGLAASQPLGDPMWRAALSSAGRLGRPIVLVLVGAPGSGKSTFAECLGPPAPAGARAGAKASGGGLAGREAAAWRRVCQDLLGSKDACLRAAKACLEQGLSVVVDRTNFSEEQRGIWLELAGSRGAECHCLVFDVSAEECCRRVASRPSHEGGLSGYGGSRTVVMKLFGMLEPVLGGEGFARVTVVQSTAAVEEEVQRYRGDRPFSLVARGAAEGAAAAGTGPARLQPQVPPAPAAAAPVLAAHEPLRAGRGCASLGARAGEEQVPPAPAAATPVPAAPAPLRAGGGGASLGARAGEEQVSLLTALGFARDACRSALEAAGGDANLAANRLLADRLLAGDED